MPSDELWMNEALQEALSARAENEVPIGAVVVCDDRIVGRGHNRTISDNDPTAHAEIVALRAAAHAIGNHRLVECEMFATLEPGSDLEFRRGIDAPTILVPEMTVGAA